VTLRDLLFVIALLSAFALAIAWRVGWRIGL